MRPRQSIATERLVLRPLARSDAARIHALISDWNVLRTLAAPPYPYRLEDAHAFLASVIPRHREGSATALGITLERTLIGMIGIDPDRRSDPSLGYWLGHAYWGRGYMSEAASALVTRYFESSDAEKLASGYFAGNGASWRIQDKLGFQMAGERVLHSRPWGKDLPHIDTILTRDRFEAL